MSIAVLMLVVDVQIFVIHVQVSVLEFVHLSVKMDVQLHVQELVMVVVMNFAQKHVL